MTDALPEWLAGWWRGDDTGMSSCFLAAAYSGSTALLQITRRAAPRDTSDVGRCVRLLDLAAANGCDWRGIDALGRMAGLDPTWAPLVPRWAEIEAAYAEDVVAQTAWRVHLSSLYVGSRGRRLVRQRRDIPCPPSRCWWLVATLRPDGYDPYHDQSPHPFSKGGVNA